MYIYVHIQHHIIQDTVQGEHLTILDIWMPCKVIRTHNLIHIHRTLTVKGQESSYEGIVEDNWR